MIAAQMLACHDAAMSCFRHAVDSKWGSNLRREYLGMAGKLSRTFAMLLDTLNRHRGKGAQEITVEHVVPSGGQAVVGIVEAPGGGVQPRSEDQPHAITYAPGVEMPSPNQERSTVPSASDVERPLPDARGKLAGRADDPPISRATASPCKGNRMEAELRSLRRPSGESRLSGTWRDDLRTS
jgi:hypothetical protein